MEVILKLNELRPWAVINSILSNAKDITVIVGDATYTGAAKLSGKDGHVLLEILDAPMPEIYVNPYPPKPRTGRSHKA